MSQKKLLIAVKLQFAKNKIEEGINKWAVDKILKVWFGIEGLIKIGNIV